MDMLITSTTSDVVDYLKQGPKSRQIVDIETTSLSLLKGEILCIGIGLEDRDDVLIW